MDYRFLACQCPRCEKSSLFRTYITFFQQCPYCSLDLSKGDAADGPAYVVMCIVMALLMTFVTLVEYYYAPSYWLHIILWPIPSLLLSLILLRYVKSMFIHIQYKTRRDSFEKE